MPDSGMRTVGVVGIGSLAVMSFFQALNELGPAETGLAHVTAFGGLLLWAVMTWRIFQTD